MRFERERLGETRRDLENLGGSWRDSERLGRGGQVGRGGQDGGGVIIWGCPKSSICKGICNTYPTIASFLTQKALKVIDYLSIQLSQRYEPYGQETLAKCSDAKVVLRLFKQPHRDANTILRLFGQLH